MFELIKLNTFDEMYRGNSPRIEVFTNFFKTKKNKNFLIWGPLEMVIYPFNDYDFQNKHVDISNLEKVLIENNVYLYNLISGLFTKITDDVKNKPLTNIEFLTWPTFLLHYSYYGLIKSYQKSILDINVNTNFEHLYSNYNFKTTYHRRVLIDNLYKNNLFGFGKNSWTTNQTHGKQYEFQYWKEEKMVLDEFSGDEFTGYYTDYFLNTKCLINVVGETLYNNNDMFITEKTFKNLLIGQPFICLSSCNFHKNLKKLGFVLYDEIFNYDFDSESEIEDRVQGIVNNLNNLKNKNYNELYKNISHKVLHNKKIAIDIINKDPFIPNKIIEFYRENKCEFDNFEPEKFYYIKDIMKNYN